MRPTRAEALQQAMHEDLSERMYDEIMQRAEAIRGEW